MDSAEKYINQEAHEYALKRFGMTHTLELEGHEYWPVEQVYDWMKTKDRLNSSIAILISVLWLIVVAVCYVT